jgi:hypothetical protein
MSLLPTSTFAGPSQAEALWAVAGSVGPGGGVTQLVAGSGITLDPSTGEGVVTINASGGGGGGVTSVTASGAGITASPTTGAVVLANTGVTSLVAGSGISVSSASGAVTVTNTSAVQLPALSYRNIVQSTEFAIEGTSTDTVVITLFPSTLSPNTFVGQVVKGNWVATDIYMTSVVGPPASSGGAGPIIVGTLSAFYSTSSYVVITYTCSSSITGATRPIVTLMRYSGTVVP